MTKSTYYLYGVLVLIAGVAIGWMVKPSTPILEMTDHSAHMDTQDTLMSSSTKSQIWTCSMHPQIRQNEPGQCPICEMDLIPLDNTLDNDDPTVLQMTTEAVKLAQVETVKVGGSSFLKATSVINVDGTVELDERLINAQSTHINGRIESLLINFEGEYVKSGQKIASIFSTDILAASQELITASKLENKVSGIKDASIQKLKNWKLSDTQIEKILATGKPIETIDIFADHSGYVLDKKISLGDYVRQGQSLYTVSQTGRLWLLFNVYESNLGSIRKGQKVKFTTPSLREREFSAIISYIEPLLDPVSRTGIVRAEISNPDNKLKPGMLLKGTIFGRAIPKSSASVTVPRTAVLWTGDQSVVYVQLPDSEIPSYQYRKVTLGDQSGEMVSITDGLVNGEVVVTNGAFAIDAAAQLNNNFSMMNKNVSIKVDDDRDQSPDFTTETPEEFKDQLDQLVQEYIKLKDGLVMTDKEISKASAEIVLAQLKSINMSLISGSAHVYWMEQMSAIESHTTKIKEASTVEEQRNQFDFLSQAVIKVLKSFGTNKSAYYVMYCPMVKNNQGADWISAEKEIRNPYFGDKMMKCGSVKIALNKDYKNVAGRGPSTFQVE